MGLGPRCHPASRCTLWTIKLWRIELCVATRSAETAHEASMRTYFVRLPRTAAAFSAFSAWSCHELTYSHPTATTHTSRYTAGAHIACTRHDTFYDLSRCFQPLSLNKSTSRACCENLARISAGIGDCGRLLWHALRSANGDNRSVCT